MKWNNKELTTIGNLLDTCYEIIASGNKEEACKFMELYRLENEYADANIGYLSGYADQKNRQLIQEWFGVSHPIFGNN